MGRTGTADRPLWLGSVKSNIGHTQAAAGVAGVIKMVQALRHGVLPATLHVDEPSTACGLVCRQRRTAHRGSAWPQAGHPRRAAVSSFGISGTNAHVILEQAPDTGPGSDGEPASGVGVVPWLVSARSAAALAGQVQRLARFVGEHEQVGVADVGYSLVSTRAAFEHRAVVLGADRAQLVAGLEALVEGQSGPTVLTGVARAGKTAFVFPGQGAQWVGMGESLYAAFPVFAQAFDAVIDRLDPLLGCSVGEVVWGDDDQLLSQTMFTQAGVFALEVGLFRLLEAWGLRPDLVAGHSIGEITAAHVAGVLTLEDAALLVAVRAQLMATLPAGGAMLAIAASEEELALLLGPGIDLAAVNAPGAVVVSGHATP